MLSDLAFASASDLCKHLRRREVSALELVELYIARIEAHDGELNAVVLRDFERPSRPIYAVLTHNRLIAVKVRALLECFAENLTKIDFDIAPPCRSAAGIADDNPAPSYLQG